MAEHAHITPATGRRRLAGGLLAIVVGSGITAGFAASVADLVPADLDTELLSLRAELTAAVAGVAYDEHGPEWSDEEITRSSERLLDACWAIIDAPPAQTSAGHKLKASAAMYQLRYSYGGWGWGGDGEEMAWQLLSEMAGDAYVPPVLPDRLAHNEPARAAA